MHDSGLILTITAGLSAALVLGYLTHRLGLSPIVGYLLAGIVVGPYTPGVVADAAAAEQLAEIGVVLLMFGVGLQFRVEELLAVGRVAIPGALVQGGAAIGVGALAARALGWSWPAGIVFGVALSIASTVVVVRVLADNRSLHTRGGHLTIGWLVVQDVLAVVALVLLPALAGRALSPIELATTIALIALKVGALAAFTFLVGKRLIPRVLDHVAATRSRELFTLTVLAVALGIALGASALFGVSMALGAFLAGLVVGQSEYSLRAASEALPMRDAFAVLFFVSVGMLLNPFALPASPGLIAIALAIVLVVNPVAAYGVARMRGETSATAVGVAIALAQIGEFSFIIGRLGRNVGLLDAAATNVIVAVAILSILVNPLLYRLVARAGPARRVRRGAPAETPTREARSDPAHRAVLVGYGPTGRTLTSLLRENGLEPIVIELNMETVRDLRQRGIAALYGDATHPDTLRAAGVDRAGHLILTASMGNSREIIRAAREMNPSIRVLARTTHLRDQKALRRGGADIVFSGEGEVALALVESVLHRLGATPEQIDRERARAHSELFDR